VFLSTGEEHRRYHGFCFDIGAFRSCGEEPFGNGPLASGDAAWRLYR